MDAIIARLHDHARTHWSEKTLHTKLTSRTSARVEVCDEEIKDVAQAYSEVAAIFDDALSRMRRLRNESAFIHRLPTEILCTIFRAAGAGGLDLPTNLAISSICSHWRAVALGDPWMWTRYDLASPMGINSAETLLQRSRPCPIEFYAYHAGARHESPLLSANIDRVSVLQSIFEHAPFAAGPDLIAPNLEHFVITFDSQGTYFVFHELPLIKEAPRLKSLELVNCRLSWRSALYSNLTILKIIHARIFADQEYIIRYLHNETDNDILEVPYASPDLEHLEIYLPDPPARLHPVPVRLPPAPAYTPIHLHALRTLELEMRDEYALRILNGVVLPEDIRIVELQIYCHRTELLDTLLEFRYLPNFLFNSLRTLLISSDAIIGSSASWSTYWTGNGRTTKGNEYALNVKIEFSRDVFAGFMPAMAFHRLLPAGAGMSSLQELDLSGNMLSNVAKSAEAVAAFIVSLPCLSTLGLHNTGFYSAFGPLRRALMAATAPPSRHTLPRLDCIRIGTHPIWATFDDVAEFAEIIPFLRLFTPRLRELHVAVEPFMHRGDRKVLRDLVDAFRGLGVPMVWWGTAFDVVGEELTNRIYPRDLWPQDEPYNWLCKMDAEHDEDESTWLRCHGCGARLGR